VEVSRHRIFHNIQAVQHTTASAAHLQPRHQHQIHKDVLQLSIYDAGAVNRIPFSYIETMLPNPPVPLTQEMVNAVSLWRENIECREIPLCSPLLRPLDDSSTSILRHTPIKIEPAYHQKRISNKEIKKGESESEGGQSESE